MNLRSKGVSTFVLNFSFLFSCPTHSDPHGSVLGVRAEGVPERPERTRHEVGLVFVVQKESLQERLVSVVQPRGQYVRDEKRC